MGIIFWWLLFIWVVAIAGYWVIRYFIARRRKSTRPIAVPAAHSDRLTLLPEYQTALTRYRLLLRLATGTITLALLLAVVLSARPATVSLITPAQQSRDIMLCLDASGSMLREDSRLLDTFKVLVTSFSGQRIGLTLFNSSAVTIIPLTDDYQLLASQLEKASTAFKVQKGQIFTELTDGTLADFDSGTSLVGDGFASCIGHLGTNPQHRSQSVILATDNEANGTPIISMTEATALAKQKEIRMYAIDPGESDSTRAGDHAQLKNLALQTGGGYYKLSDSSSVSSIVTNISKQESKYFGGTPQVATADNPKPFLYAAAILTVLSLVLMWRLEL